MAVSHETHHQNDERGSYRAVMLRDISEEGSKRKPVLSP